MIMNIDNLIWVSTQTILFSTAYLVKTIDLFYLICLIF